MKPLLLLLCFAITAYAAEPPPSPDSTRRIQSLFSETLHHLNLGDVSLKEAVDGVRLEWEEFHPKEMFPVAITDSRRASGPSYERVERITVDFLDVPYIEALRQLAALSGRQLEIRGGILQLEFDDRRDEDYVTREHPAPPEVLTALGLKPDSNPADIRRAFEHYELEFNEYVKFGYIPSRQKLVVMCFPPQQEQIAGLLFLLGKGFHLSK